MTADRAKSNDKILTKRWVQAKAEKPKVFQKRLFRDSVYQ